MRKSYVLMLAVLTVAAIQALDAHLVFAGTGGTAEFGTIHQTLSGWSQGLLGKTIAVSAFMVGMAIGITQQSLMAAALGIGSAAAMYYVPTIIDSMVVALM